ncbi:MAG: hypothetical protein ABIR70_10580 [Bryobacteraceae bacterium]
MSKTMLRRVLLVAATVFSASQSFGQVQLEMRVGQMPGWDVRQREGRCQIRVWVDNRAEINMRGDRIWITTLQGARGRDEGSQCTQPLPYNSVRNFQIRQTSGRTQVNLAQEPGRQNNYTAMIAIEDRQGGGDNYSFDVSWAADTNIQNAPAPFFDDVRACQDVVRQKFLQKNGRGSYVDFDGFAGRNDQYGNNGNRNNRQNNDSIQGRGSARSYSESRDLTYSCIIDSRVNQVKSASYQYVGNGVRIDNNNRRPLR